jgi:hypothetical protein
MCKEFIVSEIILNGNRSVETVGENEEKYEE